LQPVDENGVSVFCIIDGEGKEKVCVNLKNIDRIEALFLLYMFDGTGKTGNTITCEIYITFAGLNSFFRQYTEKNMDFEKLLWYNTEQSYEII
jgi:hypothetical protein